MVWSWGSVEFSVTLGMDEIYASSSTHRVADWEALAFTDMRNNAVRYLEVTVRGILSVLVQAMDQRS